MNEPTPDPLEPRAASARDRGHIARFQTQLALDRTTLAWIRTALTMASFGFGLVAFFRSVRQESPSAETVRLQHGAIHLGVALVALALLATVLSGLSHAFMVRRLQRGEQPILRQWSLSITVALLFVVICLAGIWELFQ
jgi:putative membrane protein